jgi:tripartite-type tricarboxylate transporter receptor subunit TctC
MTIKAGMTRRAFAAGSLGAATLVSGQARAQSYPSRPITIIVPFAAGGPSDVIARLLGQSMSTTLGQPVIVENVAGAGGTAGAARLARADPDGYTLLIHHIALLAGAFLYKNLTYDAQQLATVGLINQGPMVLVGKKDLAVSSADELLKKLKAEPSKFVMAHAGVGSNAHLCLLLLQQALSIKLTDVAYRGTGPAMNDVISGQVDLLFDQSTTAVPQVQSGTVKGFAVTGAQRLDILSNLPTMKQAGLPEFEFTVWHGLYAPQGTTADIVTKLNGALKVALADSTVQTRFASFGTQAYPEAERSIAAHRRVFDRDYALWRDVIAKSGVSIGN